MDKFCEVCGSYMGITKHLRKDIKFCGKPCKQKDYRQRKKEKKDG